jgi:hypothetical protein
MGKVFTALAVSVDGFITGRDPGHGGTGSVTAAFRLVLQRRQQ